MPRKPKVPLIKGEKRLVGNSRATLEIKQTLKCGACKRRTKSAVVQVNAIKAKRENIPRWEEVARYCDNVEGHKDGKKYFWPSKDVVIPDY